MSLYKGNIDRSLRDFKKIVEGVVSIHSTGAVHRDIKPQNIFIGDENELVLGDFGLIYQDQNDALTRRLSGTLENVGTRDWMPGWAYGRRVEDVTQKFDVFSLGKVLWAMLSGKQLLPLWYFDKDEYNLQKLFPNNTAMGLVNELLKKCIVEEEADCLENASKLMEEMEALIERLRYQHQPFRTDFDRKCDICGVGKYYLVAPKESPVSANNFGFNMRGTHQMNIFVCDNCGHVQLFSFDERRWPPAWGDKPPR